MENFNTIYLTVSVVTICVPVWSFASSLIRIYIYLRFTMRENQLNRLELFSVHSVMTIHPSVTQVVDVYEFQSYI